MTEFYRPEGRRFAEPVVEVREGVIKRLGEPEVNYEQLDRLFRNDLGLAKDIVPTIRLYGRLRNIPLLGFHMPYTHRVHVAAVAANHMKGEQGPMEVVLHEGQHLSDSVNHKIRTGVEVGLRWASYKAGLVLGTYLAKYTPHLAVPLLTGSLPMYIRMKWYRIDPSERRARKFAAQEELMEQYGDAITFPHRFDNSFSEEEEL